MPTNRPTQAVSPLARLAHWWRSALRFAAPSRRNTPVLAEIASTQDGCDWTRGYINPNDPLPAQDEVLNLESYEGRFGYDLFRNLLTDWAVFSGLQQRRLALVSAETEVLPGGDKRADKTAARFIEETLAHIDWERVSELMHYGVFYGFAIAECLWARDGANVILDAVRVRDRRRFLFDGAMRLRLRTLAGSLAGELLPERKFWAFATGADHADDPYGVGLAHWLYWPVLFKRYGIRFWMVAAEKFGSPTAAGWFPLGTSEAEQDKLLATLAAIRTDAGLILPDGMKVELLEAKRAAGGDYAALCGLMDQAIAKIILSQMAPADSTAHKLNISASEPPTWQRLTKADADLLCESFNRSVVRWLVDWNFPGAAYPRVWRRTEPPSDLAQRSEIERRIFDLGYRPTLQQIRDEYDGEWEAVPQPKPTPPNVAPTDPPEGTETPEPGPQFAAPDPAPSDPMAPLIERLGAEGDPLLGALLNPVRRLLAQSADLEAFQAGLLELYPDLHPADFAALMAQALAVADAAGRLEAGSGG
ncbi:MAG: DUF935 family protein [Candidatus Contendobacter sp.]